MCLWPSLAAAEWKTLALGDHHDNGVDHESRPDIVEVGRPLVEIEGEVALKPVRARISSGSTFEASIGYSRAVVDGDRIFVSGTTGFDYRTMTIREGVVAQAAQCLDNIEAALREAGSSLDDVVRVLYILPDGKDFEACWPVLRERFGAARPAATMIEAGLADARMLIEIQVTARRR